MEAGDEVLISVRGEAFQTVPPNVAVLNCWISTTQVSKPAALRAAAIELDRLRTDLAELGGVGLTAGNSRGALSWSAPSIRTAPEHERDPATGRAEPTGRTVASVGVTIAVRDFSLLDRLGARLAAAEQLHISHVAWQLDDDNPAWPVVRAAAVQAALARARDYAAALGGSLRGVEQLADAGLLGQSAGSSPPQPPRIAHAAATGVPGLQEADTPSLDPLPQRITAVVDARFRATAAPLDPR